MKMFKRTALFAVVTLILVLAVQSVASAQAPPNPVIYFVGQEVVETGGKKMIRYQFDVLNKNAYPNELFAASPDLPPCGTNKKAARTWVDFYDQNGKRLHGFCSLGSSSDLGKIWFSLDIDAIPPSWIYIELNDRKTATKYKSNLADTTL